MVRPSWRPSWRPIPLDYTRHAHFHKSAESHEVLIEMDALTKVSGRSALLVFTGVLVVVLPVVSAKPYLQGAQVDVPDTTVGCYVPEHNKTYAVGEKWGMGAPFGCIGMTCDGPNAFSGLSCGTFVAGPECEEDPGDQTAVYPDCCPFPKCPTDATNLNTPKPTDLPWESVNNNIP